MSDETLAVAEQRYLMLWCDVGANAHVGELAAIAERVAALVEYSALLAAWERGLIRQPIIRKRLDRKYLVTHPQPIEAGLTPRVVAAGYGNPWWEVLDSYPGVVATGTAAAAAALALVQQAISLMGELRNARSRWRTERLKNEADGLRAEIEIAELRRRLQQSEPILEAADAVSTRGHDHSIRSPEGDVMPEPTTPKAAPALEAQWARPGLRRPSVSAKLPDADAEQALIGHEYMRAVHDLAVMRAQFAAQPLTHQEAELVRETQLILSRLGREDGSESQVRQELSHVADGDPPMTDLTGSTPPIAQPRHGIEGSPRSRPPQNGEQ